MTNKILAILNPAAGGGKCKTLGMEAIFQLKKRGLNIELQETKAKGHGSALAKIGYECGYRHFISIGGDGTHHEIMNGLFPLASVDEKPTLGFLPFGTGNSFIREFVSHPSQYDTDALLRAKNYDCDIVRLTHTKGELYFINLLGMGFVADVALCRNRYFKRLGKLGYVLAVIIKTLALQYREYQLTIDGGEMILESATFLSINNSRYTGGNMLMAPAASICDGFFDVIHIKKMKRSTLLKTFPKIFTGEHINTIHAIAYQAKTMAFKFALPIPIMIDGEIVFINPIKLEILPKALTVRI